MAKEFKVGDKCYLPVEITDTNFGRDFPVQFRYFDGEDHYTESVAYKEGVLLTAEDVVSKYKTKADAMEVVSDSLQGENEKLEAELAELEKKNLELENENGKLTAKVNNLQTDCEQYKQSNAALRRTVDALTASEDKNTHRAMLMDSLIEILLEKIEEMRR
jgi:HSP20 family molecular chaperone IbpA